MKLSEYNALWERYLVALEKSGFAKEVPGFQRLIEESAPEDRPHVFTPKAMRLFIECYENPESDAARMTAEDFTVALWKAGKEIEPIEAD